VKLKIAVVQFEIQRFAPEDNLKKAEQFIKEAALEAQVIVFPEDFITVPFKGALRVLGHNQEEMFIEEVDTAILNDAEMAYQLRRT
jgi:predicted amidohydrolase